MTKRISQANTVVVPAVHADGVDGKVVATKTVVVPAEAEIASAKAEVKADEVPVTVVAEPVAALVAPAPMAMVAAQDAAAPPAESTAPTTSESSDGTTTDYTPYIVGGALVLGGVLAIALSSGDDNNSTPTPTPAPTNAVTFSSATTATVAEITPATATVIDVNATAAATGGAIVYTLGGTDAALFNIDAATGIVTLKAASNFEAKSSYSITVTATSAANGTTPSATATQTIAVTVTNVNEAPAFTSATATATIAENSPVATVVFTASAPDPDAVGAATPLPAGATVTYTLGGTDAAAFNINATTGAVTFKASPDFETKASYTFTVTATDGATPALSATQTVTVTVTDVADGPVFTSGATASIAENAAIATVVYDANTAGAATFALTGADAAAFNIDTAAGIVTFKAPANFEAKATYNISVVASGAGGATTQPVVVSVTNVNEPPTFAAATRTAAIDENVAAGTIVPGSATATDPDAGATLTYSLSGADAARFTINPTTGVVSLVASPDFETKAVYTFNVVATDQGGLPGTQAVTLNINDLPDGVRIDGGNIPSGTNTSFDAATGNVAYLESATVGNITTINNFTSGDIIQTDVATSSYSFSSVGSNLVISLLNNGVSSQITLTGAAGNNFIFNEASAEQAVGFDFFRSSVAPPPAASNNLDGAGSVSSYNAGTAANTYTDSATAPNVTTITNFTSDDRIVVTGVNGSTPATSYSFSSVGNDLTISFLANGLSSQITLAGVANPNVFVFNEATAEQAVGFDFFRYG